MPDFPLLCVDTDCRPPTITDPNPPPRRTKHPVIAPPERPARMWLVIKEIT